MRSKKVDVLLLADHPLLIFTDYNREEGKTFKVLKWVGTRSAKALIERSRT